MTIQIVNVKIVNVKIVNVRRGSKMIKKLFLVLTLLFTFSCDDLLVEDEFPMKLWLNGEEVDVQAEYERIKLLVKKLSIKDTILLKHFLKKYLSFIFRKKQVELKLQMNTTQ